MLDKVLLGAAVTLAAALAVATPANADPSSFGALGCICSTQPGDVPPGDSALVDQVNRGIQDGLASLHEDQPGPGGG